jgi:3-hydroxy-9,10-secoandrosta-1,3,5(10)-triene-9,17-dione monooxygenase reductase component
LTTGLDQARFREVLGHFATGITIVTALEDGLPVGFSCQSFAALSLDPPMVVLAPARTSTSWPRIRAAGAFCVNILGEHQEAVCRAFAISGGDKFSGVGWRPGLTGAPVIDGSLAVVECELGEIFDGGDHEIVTGRVVALDVNEGGPLLFYRGGFGRFVS